MRTRIYAAALVLGGITAIAHAQADISRWNFSSVNAAPYNSAPATTGSGTASLIGFATTTAGVATTPNGDTLLLGTGTGSGLQDPNSLSTGYTWRGRNAANGWNGNAAEYSEGFQFNVSTVGFASIKLDFDWFTTNNGIRNLQVQYTTDGTTWNNYSGTFNSALAQTSDNGGTQLIAAPNDYNTRASDKSVLTPYNEADFSSVAGVANNSKFAVRLVSSKTLITLSSDANFGKRAYASATLATGGFTQSYNGTSGNWRVDQVAIRGAAVPEPSTMVAMALGGIALLRRNRRK